MFGKQKEPKFKFELGDEVEDIITKYKGIITGRTQWIHNCNVYGVKAQTLKDGKPLSNEHFNEPQLKLVKKDVIKKKQKTGGAGHSVSQTNR